MSEGEFWIVLLLWPVGLTLFLWKPETDRAHLRLCLLGVAIWVGLAFWIPAMRNRHHFFIIFFFSLLTVFRAFSWHRKHVGSSH